MQRAIIELSRLVCENTITSIFDGQRNNYVQMHYDALSPAIKGCYSKSQNTISNVIYKII